MTTHGPTPSIDEARLARQFDRAFTRSAQIQRNRRVVRAGAMVALVAAVIGLFLFFGRPKSTPQAASLEGTVFEATTGPQSITLADGTRIETAARTQFQFAIARREATRIVVSRGELDFDVTHDPARSFEVVCGDHVVRVIGTHFHVAYDGIRFSVAVARGRVRVEGAQGSIEVGAGERWSHGDEEPPPIAPMIELPIVPAPSTTGPAPSAHVESAADVFGRAQTARLAGRSAEAAREFDALRTRHRNDPRAGLAAFELGRIRLDDLGDPSGAAEAFADAIALAPAASYREDAEARRVEALDRLHDSTRCIAARDAYLARYPNGVFRAAVTKRCAAP